MRIIRLNLLATTLDAYGTYYVYAADKRQMRGLTLWEQVTVVTRDQHKRTYEDQHKRTYEVVALSALDDYRLPKATLKAVNA